MAVADHGTFYPRAAILTATRRWRRPQTVTLPSPGAADPAVAADDRGYATVIWDAARPTGIDAAELSPTARVLALRTLGIGNDPEIAACAR